MSEATQIELVNGVRINGTLYTLRCGVCGKVQPDENILSYPAHIPNKPCEFCRDKEAVTWVKLNG